MVRILSIILALVLCGAQAEAAQRIIRAGRGGTGSATATWGLPSFDGAVGLSVAVADLSYFRVRWGITQGGPYSSGSASTANATLASLALTSLPNGQRVYFVLESVDSGGNASPYAPEFYMDIP